MKLLTLLRGLKADEHREFEKFLQSPFFRKSKTHLVFFRHLCKHHPSFEAEKAELESAYKHCFGKKSFSDQKLYNLLSALCRSVEDFMTVKVALMENGSPDHHLRRGLLVKALGMRNMGEHFRTEIRRLIDETDARPVKVTEDYLSLQQLHEQFYFHADTPKYSSDSPDLFSAIHNLDHYYCLEKLRYLAEVKTKERIFGNLSEAPSAVEVLAKTADPVLQESHPLIAIYHRLVRLYCEGVSESGFRELKELFWDKFDLLSKEEQRTLLQHLINYAIYLSGQDFPVEVESLELYKKAIDEGMLLTGGRMTDTGFRNIVISAGMCGEFDWARDFMRRFSMYLEENKKAPAISLSNANLLYCEGKLDEAQESLTSDVFSASSTASIARWLLLKIAFDRFNLGGEGYDFLVSQLNAYEKFVRNRQMSEERKLALLNRIHFIRKIAAVKFTKVNVSMESKTDLLQKLEQKQPLFSKKWLACKIEEL